MIHILTVAVTILFVAALAVIKLDEFLQSRPRPPIQSLRSWLTANFPRVAAELYPPTSDVFVDSISRNSKYSLDLAPVIVRGLCGSNTGLADDARRLCTEVMLLQRIITDVEDHAVLPSDQKRTFDDLWQQLEDTRRALINSPGYFN